MQEPIQPTIFKCVNVAKRLREVAEQLKIPPSLLDFDIKEHKTFYHGGSVNEKWKQVSPELMASKKELDHFARKKIKLAQEYVIRVYESSPDPSFRLELGMMSDSQKTVLKCVIKKGSKIYYGESLHERLMYALNKRKVLAGALIGLFDEDMSYDVQKVVDHVSAHNALQKELAIRLCSFPKPQEPVPETLSLLYAERPVKEGEEHKKQKELYHAVRAGEEIVEFIKPKPGLHGRKFTGELIEVRPVSNSDKPPFRATENIRIKEHPDHVEYYANIDGFVIQEAGVLDVVNEISVKKLSLKETGSVEDSKDIDSVLRIKEDSVIDEGIDSGVVVETDEIEVSGNVGAGAVLNVNRVVIHGQTHKNCKITAKEAEIRIHRGHLKATVVHIAKLEHGVVEADEVHLKEAFGGEVRASRIYIDELGPNNRIFVTELVDIRQSRGEGNKIIIDPMLFSNLEEEEDSLVAEMGALKNEIQTLTQEIKNRESSIKKNYGDLHQRVFLHKKNKTPIPSMLTTMLQKFKVESGELEKKKSSLLEKRNGLKRLEKEWEQEGKEAERKQVAISDSRVLCHGLWNEGNLLRFQLSKPPLSFEYIPRPTDHQIYLGRSKGDYEILTGPLEEENQQEEGGRDA